MASENIMVSIDKIAAKIGLKRSELFCYGKYMAKVNVKFKANKKARLILVTAINPTASGEGKTTVAIGLADGFNLIGKNAALALREPSLGPVFGIKGGAVGGGRSIVLPSDEINFHFTGDFHAITAANNLLCAIVDNHIYWGNELGIERVVFNRVLDMNDRALRNARVGVGYNEREEHFIITAASEIMAILCLSSSESDLRLRLGNVIVGYKKCGEAVTAKELSAVGAMFVLLKDALKPNLVQTLEGTPAFIHGGPFANIAHGCNSIIATKTALASADYVITEAGFGADLGAEKFLNIKCRVGGITPSAVVMVVTIKALKLLGDGELQKGLENLKRHLNNIQNVFGLNCIVAINKFSDDSMGDIEAVKDACSDLDVVAETITAFTDGGIGAKDLANAVTAVVDANNKQNKKLQFAYEASDTLEQKIHSIATKIYGADGVSYSEQATKDLEALSKIEAYKDFLVCIAKTPYSFSCNPKLLGAPSNFKLEVKGIEVRGGAGYFVVSCGDVLLMPGLSKTPRAAEF